MSNKFEIPLDIPNVTIEGVDINRKGDFVITVTSTEQGTPCHRCGRPLTKRCGHGGGGNTKTFTDFGSQDLPAYFPGEIRMLP